MTHVRQKRRAELAIKASLEELIRTFQCTVAEKLARMGNFDNFSMEICGCSCVHKCPGNIKPTMKKQMSRQHNDEKIYRCALKWQAHGKVRQLSTQTFGARMRKQLASFRSTLRREGMKT